MSFFSATDSVKGVFFICFATLMSALTLSLADYAEQFMSPVQVIWSRFFVHMLITVIVFLPTRKGRLFKPKMVKPQLLRSLFFAIGVACYLIAPEYLQLDEVGAFSATIPVFAVIFSILILREKVGLDKWVATGLGFAGSLIVIRPGISSDPVPVILLLAGIAIGGALVQIFTRLLAGRDDPAVTLVFTPFIGMLMFSCALPFYWTMPDFHGWLVLVALGFGSFLIYLSMIHGLTLISSSTAAPLRYTELVWTLILGYFLFSDSIDEMTILGGGIIIASGFYISYRERQMKTA